MGYRGEKVCEWSDLPVDMCAHCTGNLHAFEDSLKDVDVDDPDMWKDDDDEGR